MRPAVRFALASMLASGAVAQINLGDQAVDRSPPFAMKQVLSFKLPRRIAFLPDGRMLVTEKADPVWLVTQVGAKFPSPTSPPCWPSGRAGCSGSSCRRTTPTTARPI